MTPEDQERIGRLVTQIQAETDSVKVVALMEELNELLGDREAQTALLRAGRLASHVGGAQWPGNGRPEDR